MLKLEKKLVSNTFYLFLTWTIMTILSLIYWVVIGKTLLPEQYGIIATATNLMIFISGLSHLGSNTTISKLIPEFVKKREFKKLGTLIRFCLKITVISNFLICSLIFFCSGKLAELLKVPIIVIQICAIGTFIMSLANYFSSIVYGHQRMKKYFFVALLSQVVKVVSSSLLIAIGFTYFGPIIGFVLCFLTTIIFLFDTTWFKRKLEGIDKKQIIFTYTLPALVSSIASIAFTNIQYIVLPFFTNQEVTGLFALAVTITSPISVIPIVMSNALFPITSQLSVNSEEKKQSKFISSVIRYTIFLILPVTIFLIYYPELIIKLFKLRTEYLNSIGLVPILSLASLISGLSNIFVSSLYAIKKTNLNRNIWVFCALVFVSLTFLLTPRFSSFGLSLAYLIANILMLSLGYFFLNKYLRVDLNIKNLAKLIFANLSFLLFILLPSFFTSSSLIKIIASAFGFLVYFFILIPIRFYNREDVEILDILYKKSPIFKNQIKSISKIISKFV